MQIIGIRLYQGYPEVIHNLNPEWYPFGNYSEPEGNCYSPLSSTANYGRLYQLVTNGSLAGIDISVGCIVGKNGSGKSTLIDLYFRIINNLAYELIERKWKQGKIRNKGCSLYWAGGFDARLYFETDGKLGYVECREKNVSLVYNGENVSLDDECNSCTLNDILSKLFYTICINYSIFSFSSDDYMCETPSHFREVDGKWLRGIMHKNDGYLTPIVIHPYRDEDGTIDMGRENDLVKQRLATLSILFYAQKHSFLDAYIPKMIEYRIDTGAKNYYQHRFEKLQRDWLPKHSVHTLHKGFYEAWNAYLNNNLCDGFDEDVLEAALSYLCYKSMKICLYYQSYGALMGARLLPDGEARRYRTKDGINTQMHFDKPDYKSVVGTIVEEPVSHITLKIRQLIECLQNKLYRFDVPPVEQGIVGQFELEVDNVISLIGRKIPDTTSWSYNDIYLQLPPAIFQWDIRLEKTVNDTKQGVSLNKLSSGEKQKLQSASAILYHINNLQGVVGDEYRVPYRHVNIIMDEAELYYHPEYQRKLITDILEMLAWSHIDSNRIKSVHILLATHSPFVLSDVDKNNVLYMENGKKKEVSTPIFAANIHELLRNQFFLEHTMGEIAYRLVKKIVELYGHRGNLSKEKCNFYKANAQDYGIFVGEISEPYIRRKLQEMLVELDARTKQENMRIKWIDKEISRLQQWKKLLK